MLQEESKPTPRDEIAVLCLAFGLRHTEGRMLAQLLRCDCSTKEDLRTAAAGGGQTIAPSSTDVFIYWLRKKLGRHDIRISTIPTLGYGIDRESRNKIRRQLGRYDEEIRLAGHGGAGNAGAATVET